MRRAGGREEVEHERVEDALGDGEVAALGEAWRPPRPRHASTTRFCACASSCHGSITPRRNLAKNQSRSRQAEGSWRSATSGATVVLPQPGEPVRRRTGPAGTAASSRGVAGRCVGPRATRPRLSSDGCGLPMARSVRRRGRECAPCGGLPGTPSWTSAGAARSSDTAWAGCAPMTAEHLVGFANVAWDGGVHAFVLDTLVQGDARHEGIGTAPPGGGIEEGPEPPVASGSMSTSTRSSAGSTSEPAGSPRPPAGVIALGSTRNGREPGARSVLSPPSPPQPRAC